jgi:hypothetical protein
MFPLEHNDLGYGKHYFLNAPSLGYENVIIEMHLTHNVFCCNLGYDFDLVPSNPNWNQ